MSLPFGQLQAILPRSEKVLLVAPFIKAPVLVSLVEAIGPEAELVCVTRWRPEEIARGVSDLEVFDVCSARAKTVLLLRHDLHAKYYRADDNCLVGSANLTRTGLGLGTPHNLELLIGLDARDPVFVEFEKSLLESAVRATARIRDSVFFASIELDLPDSSPDDGSAHGDVTQPSQVMGFADWFPICSVPQQLFSVYRGDRSHVAGPTYRDALMDLGVLELPGGLGADAFRSIVGARLLVHPEIGRWLNHLGPSGLTFGEFLQNSGGNISDEDLRVGWDWLSVFLPSLVDLGEERKS